MADRRKKKEDLHLPVAGRIYTSGNFPGILRDEKALEIEKSIPKAKGATQFDLLIHGVKAALTDRYIKDFMKREPGGIIAVTGAGLGTAFYRNDDGRTLWYEVDHGDIIAYRKEILGENERDILLEEDPAAAGWMERIREEQKDAPVLIVASGLFYYHKRKDILELLRDLGDTGTCEIVFDAVNSSEMSRMTKVLKAAGYEDDDVYFHVDDIYELADSIGADVMGEEPLFGDIDRKGMKMTTSMSMKVSDRCMMVKMEHLRLG